MNGGNKISDQFNTVSCGHIMFAIKGGDPKSYFLYCNNLPGIIKHPSGRAAQASASDALDTTTRTDVGDTNSSVGSGGGFLIVESFDPNDQWGTIIPIIPDGVDISLSTPNTPLNITTGIPVSLGSITLTPTGDTFGVNNLAFEPTITTVDTVGTGNGFLDSISSIGLYDSSGNLVSSRDESVKDSILFKGPLTVSKTETYTIRGTLSPAFAIGQTITLTFDPSKNNTTFTAIKYNQSIPVATTILKLGTITVVSPPTPDISLWQKFLNWFGF
jgi:hypothetical protein